MTPEQCTLFVESGERVEREKAVQYELAGYGDIFGRLAAIKEAAGASAKKLLVTPACSWALVEAVGADRVTVRPSPIEAEKAVKNATELAGFVECHRRDGAALCNYFGWLEAEVAKGTVLNEVDGADRLEAFRRAFPECRGLSFDTISGSGPNGAVIHYKPERETAGPINAELLYLCDSGGQYLDGTTDVTRTLHFGAPSQWQRECFTRVLKGAIQLARAVFPPGTSGLQLDVLARQALWAVGLDYRHGTGHGVGHYLNVHEGPHSISFRGASGDTALAPGMTVTDEPGYYEDGAFGIRIENVLVVRRVDTPNRFGDVDFLGFDTITLCPIQRRMIDVGLLAPEERVWLNEYHARCRASLSPLLAPGSLGLAWLLRETEPI